MISAHGTVPTELRGAAKQSASGGSTGYSAGSTLLSFLAVRGTELSVFTPLACMPALWGDADRFGMPGDPSDLLCHLLPLTLLRHGRLKSFAARKHCSFLL